MATINIAITATNAQLSTFADELGYQTEIQVPQPDSTFLTEPNPQSKQDFLAEILKKRTVTDLANVKIRAIDQKIRDQREADKQVIRTSVEDKVAVTFTA